MFKKKQLKTSKLIMSDPIHINNKILIPISYINITILDKGLSSIYGTIDSKAVVVIENDNYHLLHICENDDLEEAIKLIPDFQDQLTQLKQ